MSVNMNSQEQYYQNPSTKAIIGGVITGGIAEELCGASHHILSPMIMKEMSKTSNSISNDEFIKVNSAMTKALADTGLEAKGVNIIRATKDNSEKISQILEKEISGNPLSKWIPKPIKKFLGTIIGKTLQAGENACYIFNSKKIIMPEKELSLAFFHEAGHALNANCSKIGKALQQCRLSMVLAAPISLIALCKTKKAPGEKPKNTTDKVTTFIKNNAGKLAFVACIPVLIEEGLASIKGQKLAKKLLSPELAKKVAKCNLLGFSTYLLTAICCSLGVYLGVKVKDSIASRQLINAEFSE